ncbi:MAG: hypothetical protein DME04_25165 [Candidatus Rokuibacteriota bacterium]|nr:MAG: hypothetical protein DME04_25165 [Candidatus Rokubacteria bacterium]
MRRIAAVVLSVVLVVGLVAPAAEAGSRTATNVALGLASFAVFNQLVGGFYYPRYAYAYPRYVYAAPVYYYPAYYPYPAYYEQVVYVQSQPAVEYQSQPQYQAQAQPQQQHATVVEYPHGRYELRGDGIKTPYQWVWIPKPPPPPPAAAPQQPPSTTP